MGCRWLTEEFLEGNHGNGGETVTAAGGEQTMPHVPCYGPTWAIATLNETKPGQHGEKGRPLVEGIPFPSHTGQQTDVQTEGNDRKR